MFRVRYAALESGVLVTKEVVLSPNPTEVDYPEARHYKTHTTQDGAVVVQRPLRDSRTRQWIWTNYPPTHRAYEAQWKLLERLEYRARLREGLPGSVEVWEDSSGVGGFGRVDASGNPIFTRVKFLQVYRTPRKGGGLPRYDRSLVEFVIEDPGFTSF